jgi:hypothetical protein
VFAKEQMELKWKIEKEVPFFNPRRLNKWNVTSKSFRSMTNSSEPASGYTMIKTHSV